MDKKKYTYNLKVLTIAMIVLEILVWTSFFWLDHYFSNSEDVVLKEGTIFQYQYETALYFLYGTAILPVAYVLIYYFKNKMIESVADTRLMDRFVNKTSSINSFIKYFFFRIGIALLFIALANPQYGEKKMTGKSEGIEIIIALDVSNSMLVKDLDQNMDRMAVAKLAISELLNKMHGDKVGLVVFAGNPFVYIPITTDYVAFKRFMSDVSPGMTTAQGTAIGSAIDMASEAFTDSDANKAIIVISDGENHEDDAIQAAEKARSEGKYVFTVGMGTTKGAPIPNYENGIKKGYKKDLEGNTVISKINPQMLQGIAQAGGGAYTQADRRYLDLSGFVQTLDRIEKSEVDTSEFKVTEDRFSIFLIIGFIFILLDFLIPEKWFSYLEKIKK
ncbi:MAG: VWA domain-containing protein [Crocinitomicaceae bacterium]|nr:VWA domain-containing protein [Crocinitomicaceae bacterium]